MEIWLKTFESFDSMMSYDEMCDYLCQCGYDMSDLENKSEEELQSMCSSMGETIEESYNMGKEEMIEYLCNQGCSMRDLLGMDEEELRMLHANVRKFYEGKDEDVLGNLYLYDPLFGWCNLIVTLRIGIYHDQLHYDDVVRQAVQLRN